MSSEVKIRLYKKKMSPTMNWRRQYHVDETILELEKGEKIVSYHFDQDMGELYIVTQTTPRVKDLEYSINV